MAGNLIAGDHYASTHIQLLIDDGGIIENEMLFSSRSPVLLDEVQPVWFDQIEQGQGVFVGVGNGCGGTNELWCSAVESANTMQAAQDIGKMAPEDPPVDMQLVNNDIAQLGQELTPARMMGQNAGVQHIGVGDNDGGRVTNFLAR